MSQLSPEFTAALTGLVAFAVTQGLKSLSYLLSQYGWLSWIMIDGWGSAIAAFLVTGLLFYANLALGFVPEQYSTFVPIVILFLTGLMTAFGAHLTMKSVR